MAAPAVPAPTVLENVVVPAAPVRVKLPGPSTAPVKVTPAVVAAVRFPVRVVAPATEMALAVVVRVEAAPTVRLPP